MLNVDHLENMLNQTGYSVTDRIGNVNDEKYRVKDGCCGNILEFVNNRHILFRFIIFVSTHV
jgi:hypothetical protein